MTSRLYALMFFFLLAFGLLALRAWHLQVLEHERYALRSQGNYLKTEGIPAPRGRILDRKGRVIAQDRLVVDLVYEGGEVAFKERLLPPPGLEGTPQGPRPHGPQGRGTRTPPAHPGGDHRWAEEPQAGGAHRALLP